MQFCSLAPLFSLLGKKWSTHILATFCVKGIISFGDLHRDFPYITPKILTQRLREFETFWLIHRRDDGKYQVTQNALDVAEQIQNLQNIDYAKKEEFF